MNVPKKLFRFLFIVTLVVVFSSPFSSIPASASEHTNEEDFQPEFDGGTEIQDDEELAELNDDDYEILDVAYLNSNNNLQRESDVSTQAVSSWWSTTKKDYQGISYGKWITLIERNPGNNGSITISFTKKRSNSYTGQLKVTKAKMDAFMGFNITKETTVSVSDTHSDLSKKKKYLAQYRTRTKVWKVTQQKYELENWTGKIRATETRVVTVKRQDGYNTRVKAK
ncbi:MULTISPECIES: hypothetical protein [Bacillus]|uniref:hypothetical protein n=1 Tax=Bacillus TaxID=1386 RepID=UPI00090C7E8D|nr:MULTISPECIES: hypothetical protein [Bacillus]APJ13371.1 hypothetical protein BSL056_20460 [Bacillus safensis]ATH74502.1 hypothetical protein CFN77_19885 [Bacillus altitudinis]